MNTSNSLQGFARVMAFVTLAGAVLVLATAVLAWVFLNALAGFVPDFPAHPGELSLGARLAGLTVSLLSAAIQVYGLLALRQTFLEAAAGRWLSLKSVIGFRRFAWVSVIMVFVGVVRASAYSVVFSWHNPPGSRELAISFGSQELGQLFTALLFVFAAHVFAAGREIEEENRAFI